MTLLDNLKPLLESWDTWKTLKANSDKVPELEKRITELEKKLERQPGDACPKCGRLTYRTLSYRHGLRTFQCEHEECGHKELHDEHRNR